MRLADVITTVPPHPLLVLELVVLELEEELELCVPDEPDVELVELALDEVAPEDEVVDELLPAPELDPPVPPEAVTVEDAPPAPSVPWSSPSIC
jgi:hypothetical protein